MSVSRRVFCAEAVASAVAAKMVPESLAQSLASGNEVAINTKSELMKMNPEKQYFGAEMPFAEMYQACRKEASRKKPVFFIHKYFARRITANFRMVLLGFLSKEGDNIYQQFYEPSCNRKDLSRLTVLDPFVGGGTTAFEALRFGCKVIANDLQPLSYFVTKALVEPIDEKKVKAAVKKLETSVGTRIKGYYKTTCPKCGKRADTMYAFHVKKAVSEDGGDHNRLFSSFIIAYKKDTFTVVCPECGGLSETKFENGEFRCACGWKLSSPKDGWIRNGAFLNPKNGRKTVLSSFVGDGLYPFATDVVAIEYVCPHCKAHGYKRPEKNDEDNLRRAEADYRRLAGKLPIPDQIIPEGYNTNQIRNHGYKNFSDLFNHRQLLCLGLLLDAINNIEDKTVQPWLQLAFSGMLEMNNMFCRYQQNAFKICNIFFNHAYVPITMPVENCVWGATLGTGTFTKTIHKILKGKRFNTEMYDIACKKKEYGIYESVQIPSPDTVSAMVVPDYDKNDHSHMVMRCGDSRDLSFIPDGVVDLVLTDPPYGSNVMYSELIDFFHVWNHKSSIAKEIGFSKPLSPKAQEIVVNEVQNKTHDYYQDGLTAVMAECYKKLKKNGFLVFSYHDRDFDSWMAVLRSVFTAGYSLYKAYPVQSETRTGAHTSGKNSVGIDIMLICKRESEQTEDLFDIKRAIDESLEETARLLEKLQAVDAEITLPDAQNVVLSVLFTKVPRDVFSIMRKRSAVIDAARKLWNQLTPETFGVVITERREGWWSMMFKEKWNR